MSFYNQECYRLKLGYRENFVKKCINCNKKISKYQYLNWNYKGYFFSDLLGSKYIFGVIIFYLFLIV